MPPPAQARPLGLDASYPLPRAFRVRSGRRATVRRARSPWQVAPLRSPGWPRRPLRHILQPYLTRAVPVTDTPTRLQAALQDRYRVERELGQGGMATVYLAHDLRHDRDVALKVLRPELSAILGVDRFLAEIKTTAHLQHPHILSLFDSGEADGLVYYVMPFVEGESLRDRLAREKQLPVDEALRIAREVADALEYAHGQGVVHRDIKPENILLHGGHALVADFGIALAVSRSDGGTRMTETGMSLGTPHYMSPEQAMGQREITPRADIYALGCVLYEMLSGEPPFTGPTAQAIVARVMTEEPRRLTLQRRTIPLHVEAAVLTALAKLPADRFASAGQFADALGRVDFAVPTTRVVPALAGRTSRRLVAAVPWALLVVAVAAALWLWRHPTARAGTGPVVVSTITLPDSAPLAFIGSSPYGVGMTALALSPDGALLAYVAQRGSGSQLYLRPMDRDTAFPLAGTDGAYAPFFSPDGTWLAFVAGDQLKKLRVGFGGAPIPVTTVNSFQGADWGDDGWIVVADQQGRRSARVNAETGAREELRPPFRTGKVLPGSRALLSDVTVVIPRRHEERALLPTGTDGRYVPTGHIAYALQGDVWAAPFDLGTLRVTGEPFAVVPHVRTEAGLLGRAQYTFARNGLLVYATGERGDLSRLVIHHRSGRVEVLPFEPAPFGCLALAPGGARLVARVADPGTGQWDLWIYDLVRHTRSRLTFGTRPACATWSADGSRVAYTAPAGDRAALWTQGTGGGDHPLLASAASRGRSVMGVWSWSADGKRVAAWPLRSDSLVVIDLDSGSQHLVATGGSVVWGGVFSPDGHWIAYSSDESGQDEIYVQPYPVTGQRWRISRDGGEEPLWTKGGRELVYRSGQEWWAVSVSTAPRFTAGEPSLVVRGPYINAIGVEYAVSADGEAFYLLAPVTGATTTNRLTVVTNWFTLLRGLADRARR